jgi:peptidyl-prolyl cis-trans isomerase SurA
LTDGARTAPPQTMDIAMPGVNVTFAPIGRWFACAATVVMLALPVAARAQVVVVANGAPITEFDIQQRAKLLVTSAHKRPSRKEIIQELIDDRLKIAKAKTYGLTVSDTQVERAFEGMAKRQGVSKEQFVQYLTRSGISPKAVKARVRAELTWSEMIRGKYAASLNISDADIAKALRDQNESDASSVGYIYTLYPVTIVVPAGSSEAVIAAKRREAENLRSRFDNCREGLVMARALRDSAVREPVTRSSADLPKPLQELLGKMPLGHLTTPDVTAQGLQMFALCGKQQTATESPLKREMRDKLFKQRFEAESKKFLDELRRGAMIEYK